MTHGSTSCTRSSKWLGASAQYCLEEASQPWLMRAQLQTMAAVNALKCKHAAEMHRSHCLADSVLQRGAGKYSWTGLSTSVKTGMTCITDWRVAICFMAAARAEQRSADQGMGTCKHQPPAPSGTIGSLCTLLEQAQWHVHRRAVGAAANLFTRRFCEAQAPQCPACCFAALIACEATMALSVLSSASARDSQNGHAT